MSICTDAGSFVESKTTVVQTSNVGFTAKVSDYLVVHTGPDHLVGLVVKASASRAEDPGFESRLRWDFSGVEACQCLKN